LTQLPEPVVGPVDGPGHVAGQPPRSASAPASPASAELPPVAPPTPPEPPAPPLVPPIRGIP